jgi:hypothetical protein
MAEPETDLIDEGKTRQDRQDREDKTGQTGQGRQDRTEEKTGQQAMSSGSWPGPIALLQEAWQIYKKRFWTLLGVSLVPLFATLILALALGLLGIIGGLIGLANSGFAIAFLVILIVVLVIAEVLLMAWTQIALLIAIANSPENVGIKECYRLGRSKIYQFLWIGILSSLIVFGGLFLLLIPGIIFSYWFFFSSMIIVFENEKGMDALLKSREYARGHWWGLVGRSLFISIIILVVSAGFGAIGSGTLGNIATFVLNPLVMVYTYLMYRNAKTLKGEAAISLKGPDKNTFIAIAVFGIIASIALVAALFVGITALSNSGILKNLMESSITGLNGY